MISKIYHISDLHIRNFKRHKEYQEVFQRLFKYINETKDEKSVIFLGGDIVHSKTDMSPELVDIVSKFLKQCADTLPTILILGNHDLNLNNCNRLDALTPIVEALNHPNLYFWKESGVYKLDGVHFSVFSVLGLISGWVPADQIKGKYKIALHHGAVHNANTDLNYQIKNETVTIDRFAGFDLGLLGDIHVPGQFMNPEKTVAYPGSLIVQNYGEFYGDHGIIVWDLKTKKGEFVPIKNDYGYYTFEFRDGRCTNDIGGYPKYLRVRVKYENTSKEQIQDFFKKIGKKSNIQEIIYHRRDSNIQVNYDRSLLLKDMRDIENQNHLIIEYAKEVLKITDEDMLDGIRHINRLTNSTLVSNTQIIRNVTWKPKKFEFENMFSYGEENSIDFTEFDGIYGLFSANATGKSAALNNLTFCLFDKTAVTGKAAHVLNIKKKNFKCKLNFELNGFDYFIERKGEVINDKGNVRVVVNFWMVDENGERVDLNGKERDDTNKIIRDHIGTYEDFVMTVLSSQVDNQSFVDKSQRERKDLLYKFLDIAIFDDLQRIAKDVYRELKFKIKELEKIDSRALLKKSETNLQIAKDRLVHLHSEIAGTKAQIKEFNEKIRVASKEIASVDGTIDLVKILKDQEDAKNAMHQCLEDIQNFNDEIASREGQLSKIIIDPERIQELESILISFDELSLILQKERQNHVSIENEVKKREEKITHLESHEYDPNCSFCVKNPFVIDANQAKNEIEQWRSKLSESMQVILDIESQLNPQEQLRKEFQATIKDRQWKKQLEDEINILQEKRNSTLFKGKLFREKYSKLLEDEITYHKQETVIERNLILEKEIQENRRLLKDLEIDETKLQAAYRKIYSEIQVENQNVIRYNTNINEYSKTAGLHYAYELYIQAISKEGVPYRILTLVLPVLEYEINQILSQLVEFSIKLEATDEKYIHAYIVYSEDKFWPVEMTSGMERFIISQAIRSALVSITNLPKANFIAIDEGFGVLDPDNLNSVYLLFEHLKQKVDFVLCISHIDSMKDMVDKVLTIERIDGFSRIQVA